MIFVAEPVVGADEKAALAEVIDSGWITMGERVRCFEKAFANAHGAADCVAVSSCTAGLHLILHALGLGAGDEVLVPSLTFVATASSVLYVGARPVFVDIESTSWPVMSLRDASAKLTSRTKAVIFVHYAGYASDKEQWQAFAAANNLLLIEDAAHAAGMPGAGTYGAAAAFSLYGNKNMTTAEGGVVFAPDEKLRERIRQMRGHGLTSGTFQRHASGRPTYDVTMLGFNYRMDELRAAIGLVQLRNLPAWNAKRRSLAALYRAQLARLDSKIEVPFIQGEASSYHIMPVILPKHVERQKVISALFRAGIQTTIHYPPVHLLSFYRQQYPDVRLPITEDYAARELTLPLHPRLAPAHVEEISRHVAQATMPVRETAESTL